MRLALTAWILVAAVGLASLPPRSAWAQDDEGPSEAPRVETGSLRAKLGVAAARRLLGSSDERDRIRGVVRLGSVGSAEAIDTLVEALSPGTSLWKDERAMLTATRVLAPHAKEEAVRLLLARVMTATGADTLPTTPLSEVARGTAALALARGEDDRALTALGAAVLQGGPGSRAARSALIAYPPASIKILLGPDRALSPALSELLADLSDLRAIPRLRSMLRMPDRATQVTAARALARLGDWSAAPLARAWLGKEDGPLREAAVEILVALGARESTAAIAIALKSPTMRGRALDLALEHPSEELVSPLLTISSGGATTTTERAKVVRALGAAGGQAAARKLVALLDDEALRLEAAFALGTMTSDAGRSALEGALEANPMDAAKRRLVTRASLTRALTLGDAPAGLVDRLEAMATSKESADRELSVFGRVALGEAPLERYAGDADIAIAAAAARGAFATGQGFAAFGPALRAEAERGDRPSLRAVVSGVAWIAEPTAPGVSTASLVRWAEEGGALGPLAARALTSRDDEAATAAILRLLEGTDPVLRAHVALGMATAPRTDSVSVLARTYQYEANAEVRRAIVRALAQRTEPQRLEPLRLAADLDPDADVRALARSAMAGRDVMGDPLAAPAAMLASLVWVSLISSDGAAAGARAARLVRADGIAVPLVSATDGALLVPGQLARPSQLELAPSTPPGDARPR